MIFLKRLINFNMNTMNTKEAKIYKTSVHKSEQMCVIKINIYVNVIKINIYINVICANTDIL